MRLFGWRHTVCPGSPPCTSERLSKRAPNSRRSCASMTRANIARRRCITSTIRRFRRSPYLAVILWILGYPEQARRWSVSALQYAEVLNQANLTAHVRVYGGAGLAELLRDTATVRGHADAIVGLADQHSLHYFRLSGLILRGWVMAQEGATEAGLALMRQSAAERLALGVGWYQIRYLCMLAATHLQAGAAEEGLGVIAQATDLVAQNNEHMWEAELRRLEGELRPAMCSCV